MTSLVAVDSLRVGEPSFVLEGILTSNINKIRTFHLVRDEDESGVSGVGVVAEGVLLSSTKVVISWLTIHKSIAIYDSLAEMEAIHGHGGKTRVVWNDQEEEEVEEESRDPWKDD